MMELHADSLLRFQLSTPLMRPSKEAVVSHAFVLVLRRIQGACFGERALWKSSLTQEEIFCINYLWLFLLCVC